MILPPSADNTSRKLLFPYPSSPILSVSAATIPMKRNRTELVDEKVHLHPEQQRAIEAALSGRHLFLTGSAGVGKSFTLIELIRQLPNVFGDRFAVSASTGIASVQINAVTVHSLFGIHPDAIKRKPKCSDTWKEIDVLVIDEISMIHPDMFVYLNKQAQISRRDFDNPFGGVQVIAVGDFFQLPPVHKERNPDIQFVFELDLWKTMFHGNNGTIIELSHVFRQSDEKFVSLLERIRRGGFCLSDTLILESRPSSLSDNFTKLYGRCRDVDAMNERQLSTLPGEPVHYKISIKYESNPGKKSFTPAEKSNFTKTLVKNLPLGDVLTLKKDARVMLVANVWVAGGLSNGSRGVVVDFDQETNFPIVQFTSIKAIVRPYDWVIYIGHRGKATVACVPLKLAYAITIHKSQGQSIDGLDVDMKSIWEYGQAYTALSRARSLDNLIVRNFSKKCIKTNPKVVSYYSTIPKQMYTSVK